MKKSLIALALLAPLSASACITGHWVQEVSNGGGIITLENSAVLKVNPSQQYITSIWLPTDELIICPKGGSILSVIDKNDTGSDQVITKLLDGGL
ncbi:hypothetical protein DMS64_00015 [Klebsiella variicola]|uniref:hypothetical protein n=1 Tax=Klebsiella variicola TaxID=244366 RepID=UPI000D748F9B|nr:hypothetical protein [Klebsiella variicola]PXM28568.1 hypothetical protein DMS64_00015 [Klebsiella variicola]